MDYIQPLDEPRLSGSGDIIPDIHESGWFITSFTLTK